MSMDGTATAVGDGSVVVVTGGASGIGLGIAGAFGRTGATVVLADVRDDALTAACTALSDAGLDVAGHVVDVSNGAAVDELAAVVLARFGRVDVICNNAGVTTPAESRLWELPVDDWEWVLGVNLWGVIHGVRAFVPHLVEHGGHVVNVASMAGVSMMATYAPYAASKHAVVAISETLQLQLLAAHLAVGVAVVLPSRVATNIMQSERNRPGGSRAAGAPEAPGSSAPQDRHLVTADSVGELVLDAVRCGRFYVPTHSGSAARVAQRVEPLAEALRRMDDPTA